MDKLKYTLEQDINTEEVARLLLSVKATIGDKPLLIVGIGTPKVLLDSIGPYIATQLQVRGFKVRGTLRRPVHALNIRKFIKSINLDEYFVIALDASVGEDIGSVIIRKGAIHPGASVGKTLPTIGNVSIKFIVAKREDFYDNSPEAVNNALEEDKFNLIPMYKDKIITLFKDLRKGGII